MSNPRPNLGLNCFSDCLPKKIGDAKNSSGEKMTEKTETTDLEAVLEKKTKMRREAYDRRNAQEANRRSVSKRSNDFWPCLSTNLPKQSCGTFTVAVRLGQKNS